MPKYTVTESRVYDFTYDVEADSPEEAINLVANGEIERVDEQPGETTYFVEDEDGNHVARSL